MLELTNGSSPAVAHNQSVDARGAKPKVGEYTGTILLRTRPKTYRKIVELLAHPDWSVLRISEACKVSRHTVDAIAKRELSTIDQRKSELLNLFTDVSHVGAVRMMDTIGKASLRDATIATGVSVDKVLAIQGLNPNVVAVQVNMPSAEEQAERRAMHAKLDAITKRLSE